MINRPAKRVIRTGAIRIVAVSLFVLLAGGCGAESGGTVSANSVRNAKSDEAKTGLATSLASNAAAQMEKCIDLWANGDRLSAEEKFMAVDWTKAAPGRPLFGVTEKEFAALSPAEQDAKRKEIFSRSQSLRELGRFLLATAKTARDSADPQKARRYFQAICDGGQWLSDESNGALIVNMIGKALLDAGRKGLDSLPKN